MIAACDDESAGRPDDPPMVDDRATECSAATARWSVPVVMLRYLPTADGERIDAERTGMDISVAELRANIDAMAATLERALEDGSRYHGWGDASAACAIDYGIVRNFEYLEPVPRSETKVPWNQNAYRPDYRGILEQHQICELVDNQGVREVWMWGYHHGDIEPAESNMAGPFGDVSNSERTDDMPVCQHSYTLYNYNYARGAGEALHDHGHQIESVMKDVSAELFDRWRYPKGSDDENAPNGCGDVHFPPNTLGEYQYSDATPRWSDCGDWRPGRDGAKTQVSCDTWGCGGDPQLQYLVWWMQNMPGLGNGLGVGDWWEAIADFDTVKRQGFTEEAPPMQKQLCDYYCEDWGYTPGLCFEGWECQSPCLVDNGCTRCGNGEVDSGEVCDFGDGNAAATIYRGGDGWACGPEDQSVCVAGCGELWTRENGGLADCDVGDDCSIGLDCWMGEDGACSCTP